MTTKYQILLRESALLDEMGEMKKVMFGKDHEQCHDCKHRDNISQAGLFIPYYPCMLCRWDNVSYYEKDPALVAPNTPPAHILERKSRSASGQCPGDPLQASVERPRWLAERNFTVQTEKGGDGKATDVDDCLHVKKNLVKKDG
jgi:hypothetical protein